MPLTPADVHNVAFKKPPIGKRGYDEEEVDAFLDEVERELARLIEENNELRAQLERGGGGRPAGPGADPRLASELAETKSQLDRLQREKAQAEQAARGMQAEIEQLRSQGAGSGSMRERERLLQQSIRTAGLAESRAINIGFVDGHLLDDRAGFGDEAHDFARFLFVNIHARADEDAFGTESPGGGAGHGGAHTEFARLITGCANHAALRGRRADDDRLSAQRRFIALLH